ncbi:MAG: tryptophan-rich sensory protein [Candidatus Harrisonbacteria bacterium]|nr:tryptophan-rich sensory protein [Candidatus Harrisonbacteria bacterium]
MNNFFKLVIAIGICELAGVIGSLFTAPAIPGWYAGLAKSELTPPGWIFGPVWTALYALMGVAAFLIWKRGLRRKEIKTALIIFDAQLVLNVVWSIIFFGLQSPGWALVDIALLWLAIVWTIAVFYKISKPAAYLLLPYFLWVSFASYLNYSIWQLNSPREWVACTQDAKLCPDGSYVGRVGPSCEFAACPNPEIR